VLDGDGTRQSSVSLLAAASAVRRRPRDQAEPINFTGPRLPFIKRTRALNVNLPFRLAVLDIDSVPVDSVKKIYLNFWRNFIRSLNFGRHFLPNFPKSSGRDMSLYPGRW